MESILQQITAIDGVIGCSLYNHQGKILASACPLILDVGQLQTAAETLIDCMQALQISDSLIGMDLRFAEGRLMIRPLEGAFLNVLCAKNVNTSMVNITLNLALRKLEQKLPKAGEMPVKPVVSDAGMSLRIAHLQKSDASSSFDQLGMVAVSQSTARQFSDFFGKPAKKIRITTSAGNGGIFPVIIINDLEFQYDSALVVGPAIERKLKAAEGDMVTVSVD